MIKANGLNYPRGNGDRDIFGYCNGSGYGGGIKINFSLHYNGDGKGSGTFFKSQNIEGNGKSYSPRIIKEEFFKH